MILNLRLKLQFEQIQFYKLMSIKFTVCIVTNVVSMLVVIVGVKQSTSLF